jgi:hypothetical protein
MPFGYSLYGELQIILNKEDNGQPHHIDWYFHYIYI